MRFRRTSYRNRIPANQQPARGGRVESNDVPAALLDLTNLGRATMREELFDEERGDLSFARGGLPRSRSPVVVTARHDGPDGHARPDTLPASGSTIVQADAEPRGFVDANRRRPLETKHRESETHQAPVNGRAEIVAPGAIGLGGAPVRGFHAFTAPTPSAVSPLQTSSVTEQIATHKDSDAHDTPSYPA